MRRAERLLTNGVRDTRDEIGFLILHQVFAGGFSQAHPYCTHELKYTLFVPWLYCQAAADREPGREFEGKVRNLLIALAVRLNLREKSVVIGGDKRG